MRETGFYWCKQCETALEPGIEADFCPDCNSQLMKGKLILDMRKLILFAVGLSLMFQYLFVLGNAVFDLIRPVHSTYTSIQVTISTIFFITGLVIVVICWFLKIYPFVLDFSAYERTDDLFLGFRHQIAQSGRYHVVLVPILLIIIGLLTLYIGSAL